MIYTIIVMGFSLLQLCYTHSNNNKIVYMLFKLTPLNSETEEEFFLTRFFKKMINEQQKPTAKEFDQWKPLYEPLNNTEGLLESHV